PPPACQSLCTSSVTPDEDRGMESRPIGAIRWLDLPSSNTLCEHGTCPEGFVRFFVNADDVGMSRGVNDETFDLLRLGLIDSASIIANAPYAEAAIEAAKVYAQCAFGVHL